MSTTWTEHIRAVCLAPGNSEIGATTKNKVDKFTENSLQANRMKKQFRARSNVSDRFTALGTIVILLFAGALTTVEAAEWRIEPVLRAAADFEDNPFLSILTDFESQSGYIVEGSAEISYFSDKSSFYVEPTLRTRAYGSSSPLDSDDQFLSFGFNKSSQSTDFRIRGNYSRESVRTAERADTDFDITDPDDIPDDDTGVIDIQDRRERLLLTPSLLYRLNDISALSARLNYQDVRYDEAFAGVLTDYTDSRLNISYRRSWSERNIAILGATYRKYQTDQGDNEVDGIGFNVGFDRAISQTTQFRATAGLEDTETSATDSEVSWVTNISLVRQLQTTTLLAQYERSISASGSGALGARDSINLNFTRRLNDLISAGIGARVYSTNSVDKALTFDERDYVQLRAQFTWYISPVYSIDANYRYTFLNRAALLESANSNQITLWFNYRPLPITRSR